MYKKTITYTDYNDVEQTEDFYFNLNKAELVKIQLQSNGTLQAKLERLLNTREVSEIAQIFQDIIDMSYGVKSDDGKRFIKNQEVLDAFKQTEAYSELFVELTSNADAAIEFITGIIPAKIAEQINQDEIKKIKEKANS
jgi:hypothetical protein